ncbi:DUF7405 family protein [Natrialbaceae archaeon AArc-T1-2]|uniref:DUF7405 family protein n=1 Tax=Natrialbaceae archaeon AArc-T1-2 TaxID=3053904 RepID=UPI00255A9DFA|nr:Tat pathway signal protein [Natrialbaceae archaeon AArc-T1-2]WIV66644.1 Tat pathway signal protein [Natrialbaceae archaeon AArc-T1-2]
MTPGILDPGSVSRRAYLKSAVAAGGSVGLAACVDRFDSNGGLEDVPQGDPETVPSRQHAWNEFLPTDDHGNVRPPRHHVLGYVDLADGVDPEETQEPFADALADLEQAFEWSNEGLLFTVGYSPSYFDRFDADLPDAVDLPAPESLSDLEEPELDRTDLLIHLASDRPDAVIEAEEALVGDAETANGQEVTDVTDLLERVDRRTGFVGAGLPQENRDVSGVPDDAPIPEEAPLFMGFMNGFREAQASEDRVTIEEGPFEGATTEHVSTIEFQLRDWWHQENHFQRVAKMFSPTHADDDLVGEHGERFDSDPRVAEVAEDVLETASQRGVVGHAQKAASARVDGEPILLRRDFDSTDDDRAGLHFLSLQREIADFVRVREAITGAALADETSVGRRVNNGILQYFFVRRRANALVPPRPLRSFPRPDP